MREIKFRGKSDKYEWVYGNLSYREEDGNSAVFIEDQGFCGDLTSVERNTIGQYTGLKDKNGKEIYEGDIVRYHLTDERYKKNPRYSNLPIHYDERQARFEAGNIYWDTLRSGKVEVIGNIHDNPELIDDKE